LSRFCGVFPSRPSPCAARSLLLVAAWFRLRPFCLPRGAGRARPPACQQRSLVTARSVFPCLANPKCCSRCYVARDIRRSISVNRLKGPADMPRFEVIGAFVLVSRFRLSDAFFDILWRFPCNYAYFNHCFCHALNVWSIFAFL